ncbi:MAG: hypothetical protein KC420_18580 [Myxococcales bacterium]|nr:hypothetical protein [Myxococcales bacterium]MCB9703978.1 hypothetical protein [Myxococcales bacterium]
MRKLASTLRFISAYVRLVRNPAQLDVVFKLIGGADGSDQSGAFERFFGRDDVQALIARRMPPLELDLVALRRLPEGTVGRAFAEFIDVRGFDITDLHHHNAVDSSDPVVQVKLHLERSHDLWHVVTGFDTDVAGELGLQAFYLANIDTPVALAILSGGLLNALLRDPADGRRRLEAVAIGWRHGKAARSFMGLDWAALLRRPLAEVRAELGITEAMAVEAGRLGAAPLAAAA